MHQSRFNSRSTVTRFTGLALPTLLFAKNFCAPDEQIEPTQSHRK